MKGLDSVFNVSLAKLLGSKSFMLLCSALLGLSPLPWEKKKKKKKLSYHCDQASSSCFFAFLFFFLDIQTTPLLSLSCPPVFSPEEDALFLPEPRQNLPVHPSQSSYLLAHLTALRDSLPSSSMNRPRLSTAHSFLGPCPSAS